jgi:hypothetical protein
MIISLFMDEAPLVCGSGNNLGARAGIGQAGRVPGKPRGRGDDRDDHEKHAEDVHVSTATKKFAGRRALPARGLSW